MATGNQNTFDHMTEKIGIRLPPELRARLDDIRPRVERTRSDIIRQALEYYLPILEATLTPKGKTP